MAYTNFSSFENFQLHFGLESITHIINRHMNLSDHSLANRKLDIASTFICDSAFDLWFMIKHTIENETQSKFSFLKQWIKDDNDYEDYLIQTVGLPDGIKGRSYNKDKDIFADCKEFVIILRKQQKTGYFYLANAYPYPEGYDPDVRSQNE
ncbi:MAG: hypothetical protein NC347_00255 [Clostridium sp.]|nr:hypothetical protein [Clostridium sp.]